VGESENFEKKVQKSYGVSKWIFGVSQWIFGARTVHPV
jgi:hypothetical protein